MPDKQDTDIFFESPKTASGDGWKLFSKFKRLASDLVKLTFLSYVVGFFVINSYFLKCGFFSYDISSPRYILAGVILIIICSAILAIFVYVINRSPQKKEIGFVLVWLNIALIIISQIFGITIQKNFTEKTPFFTSIGVILYPIMLFCIIPQGLLFDHMNNKRKFLVRFVSLLIAVTYYFVFGSREFLWLSLVTISIAFYCFLFMYKGKDIFTKDLANNPHGVSGHILCIFGILYLFGIHVYPHIDRIRGGGSPIYAELFLEKSALESISDLSIDLSSVRIIHESYDSFFILNSNKKIGGSIQIPKKGIVAVVYHRDNRPAVKTVDAKAIKVNIEFKVFFVKLSKVLVLWNESVLKFFREIDIGIQEYEKRFLNYLCNQFKVELDLCRSRLTFFLVPSRTLVAKMQQLNG